MDPTKEQYAQLSLHVQDCVSNKDSAPDLQKSFNTLVDYITTSFSDEIVANLSNVYTTLYTNYTKKPANASCEFWNSLFILGNYAQVMAKAPQSSFTFTPGMTASQYRFIRNVFYSISGHGTLKEMIDALASFNSKQTGLEDEYSCTFSVLSNLQDNGGTALVLVAYSTLMSVYVTESITLLWSKFAEMMRGGFYAEVQNATSGYELLDNFSQAQKYATQTLLGDSSSGNGQTSFPFFTDNIGLKSNTDLAKFTASARSFYVDEIIPQTTPSDTSNLSDVDRWTNLHDQMYAGATDQGTVESIDTPFVNSYSGPVAYVASAFKDDVKINDLFANLKGLSGQADFLTFAGYLKDINDYINTQKPSS